MVETYQRRTPLAHLGLVGRAVGAKANAGLTMSELGHRIIVNIRGTASDTAFTSAVQSATGLSLPTKANTATTGSGKQILWLGPNEWWVTAADGQAEPLVESLRAAFVGQHATACDVSESRVILSIKGAQARAFLARGVSYDLHPRNFSVGDCVQTGLSRANALIHQVDGTPTFEIYVLKSFADYIWRWLETVAVDFDLAVGA